MQVVDGRLILSPTDLVTYLGCAHATALDVEVARGVRPRPAPGVDDQLAFIADRGLAHERAYLQALRDEGRSIVEIPRQVDPMLAERATVEAMRSGVDVIYQATFFDGTWVGYADFLLRREHPGSPLGGWVYDVADTKLARHLSAAALLQLATYARRLEALQGVPPERVVVVTGEGLTRSWPLADVSAYAAHARAGFERFLADTLSQGKPGAEAALRRPEAVPVAGCGRCRWREQCSAAWHDADDLSLVAGMRRGQRAALRAAGIEDLTALAGAGAQAPPGLTGTAYRRLRRQAALQVQERAAGRPLSTLLPPVPGRGLARLPAPDAGDLYLDFEGDPFAGAAGREYLAGVLDRDDRFHSWWAHDEAAEGRMVGDLLGFLMEQWRLHPGLHVYHYAPYETAALKRLTGRHGVGEVELDALLRGGRFIDLYTVVKQGMVIGKASYSLKKMEDFYWGHIRRAEGEEVSDALSSVVEYERWLAGGGDDILTRIADYNREDVRSTLALHDWLEDRRAELLAQDPSHATALVRPVHASVAEADESAAAAAERELAQRLLDTGEELFAGLVGWHRREERPEWWDFFRRADMADEELLDDAAAVGRVGSPTPAGEKTNAAGRVTSRCWRYPFPAQPLKLEVGKTVHDVDTRKSCGTVVALDADAGEVLLSRRAADEPACPRGLMPPGPINSSVLREAVARQATLRLAGPGALPSPGLALVDAIVPSALALLPGEAPTEAVVRVGRGLAGEVLAVQGPPGAGKTYAASHLIRALLDDGRRVGVTAQSHAVIRNLLAEVGRPAVHKVTGGPRAAQDTLPVVEVTDNATVLQALADGEARLVGGTAWLWARPDFTAAVDVLVIDEAGQFSLANALAVAGSARSLVLLGDPQQLTQPTKADHPGGAGVSALGHLLGEHEVIPADRGLFLDVTYRMHPDVTSFVSRVSYQGRLRAAPGRERQRVDAPGVLAGSGLRHVAVAHEGNGQESAAEAAVVAALLTDLLQGGWTDADGSTHAMTATDVLVVAPYNAHVRRLTAAVPPGVRVGTVDAFQGQQAPVVIYSTASSSAADAPRGLTFLYDVHRLNVAVSRAKALAVWVGSPALLDAAPGTAEEVRLVNALCAFAAAADTIVSQPPSLES